MKDFGRKVMNEDIFLVDTSCWAFFFRLGKDIHTLAVQNTIRKLEDKNKIVTCGIVLAEFIQGLGKSQKENRIRQILENHGYLETFKEIYILAGELSKNLAEKGLKTPLSDCLIAATATIYKVTLVTDDPHFKRFSGLKLKFID